MSINYEEELLNYLENNTYKTLPSQAVIDSSERMVKAIWKNFIVESREDEPYTFSTWYIGSDWGTRLQKYKDNIPLWEELFESKFNKAYWPSNQSSYDFILSGTFRHDYPVIADHFLCNNDKLIKLFNKTRNQDFYKRLTLDINKKEDLLKSFLIENSSTITNELIEKFEADSGFVKKLLNKSSRYFGNLSKENRNNDEYIRIALSEMDNFFLLSEEKQDKYFNSWANKFATRLRLKNLESFKPEQQSYILSCRQDLLSSAISSDNKNFRLIAVSCLLVDVKANINSFSEDAIKVFASNKKNLEIIKPQLENFVEAYSDGGVSKKDNKMVFLLRYFPELKEKIEENIFYQINQLFESKKKFGVDWFEDVAKKIIELYDNKKVNIDTADFFITKSRGCLTIEALKELRLPKLNAFDHVKTIVLNKKLQEDLGVHATKKTKIKI